MNKDIKPNPAKPKLSVPNTQVSIADNQSSTNYIIICCVFMGLIILVGGYFIWNLTGTFFDQSNRIKALEKQKGYLDDKKKNLETLNNGPLKEIQKKNDKGVSDADLIMNALPLVPDQKNLYAMMEEIANESQVKMQDIALSTDASTQSTTSTDTPAATPGAAQTPKELNYDITIVGSYKYLLDFLANTEKSARVMNFRKMSLDGSIDNVTAKITFTTYYQDAANIDDHQEPLQ